MNVTFSCQEPAARVACLNLSAAEIAALILFHRRTQKRLQRNHGEISMHPPHNLTMAEIHTALDECKSQYQAHEARLLELAAILHLQKSQGKKIGKGVSAS